MSNEQFHIHYLTKKINMSNKPLNHRFYKSKTLLTIIKCINVWCFDKYVTSGVFEVKGLYQENNHAHKKIRQIDDKPYEH